MNQYPVKAVSRITGLSPENLRAWERRYGVVEPGRDAAGRRAYSAADVERLRLYKRLVDAGHAIRHVAAMDEPERQRLIAELDAAGAPPDLGPVREELMSLVERYDAAGLERRLGLVMATLEVDLVVEQVLSPLLEAVGRAWRSGDLDIAQERLLSGAIRSRVLAILGTPPDLAPAILAATPSGERHELGLLMFALRAARRLVPLRYLGPDLPLVELQRLARRFRPRVLALSLVNPPAEGLAAELAALAADAPEVWLGGQGAADLRGHLPDGCRILASAGDIRRALDGLAPAA